MYLPPYHQLPDPEIAYTLIETEALGAWVCHAPSGLIANHVPFVLDRTRGPHGTLLGHVSRGNSVWRNLTDTTPSVVLFQGAQSYITPNWYPSKVAHGKVVPTWDYVVAHAHGTARVVEDPAWMLDMLNRLTNAQEAGQPAPWRVGDAPPNFIEKLLRGIVGIEIPIDRLEGKLKASQDEDLQDRHGTVAGLQSTPHDRARTLATLIANTLKTPT